MATTVSEVRRGDFIYHDALFVDLGSGKRHPRAGESELRALLLPSKTKNSGSSSAVPIKDQVAHWYEAQLLHYGLPRTQDKNSAKLRLTQALHGGGLSVPAEVRVMEAAMKKDYASVMRKVTKVEKEKGQADVIVKGKKRKLEEEDDNDAGTAVPHGKIRVTVDVDLGLAGHEFERPKTKATATATAKKMKGEPASRPAAKTTTTQKAETDGTRAYGSSVVGRGRKGTAAAPLSTATASTSTTKPRAKQTGRRSAPFMGHTPSYRQREDASPQKVQSYPPTYFHDQNSECDLDDSPPPYDSHDFSRASAPSSGHKQAQRGGTVQISGHYDITATTPDSYVTFNPSFVLVVDKPNQQLWGSMTILGKMRCMLFADSISSMLDATGSFSWRAEDYETGQYMFRMELSGQLEFDQAGGVKGRFFGLLDGEDVVIQGDLTHGYGMPGVDELKAEWAAIPRRAYGRG
ncbi:uncharacterized protein HMPREF1541_05579 [Cyphellophora europaea CBS 101466]|uniref:Uncharacterized protein n=1 Tax=Cyphellophora europaea (strain CBS 101466) TaxID=1220924 RepID=W2RS68_CYPE1|nr:uncharacterized protein HMPREF1541_05579 [Cyphellophora europaea CBS 101466]ETN39356.1 hypothetical protein HMPREF1541_05579 [Cyphellophora europaea CBS 101466]